MDIPGRSCLLTDVDDLYVAPPSERLARRSVSRISRWMDPGDDAARRAGAATEDRQVAICAICGVSVHPDYVRRAKSGKAFCRPCAERTVEAYYRRHPEARPVQPRIARERTGTSYVQERERYAVRYHAGHARWQISDTQTRRWTSHASATEADAQAVARAMNEAWRAQLAHERESLGRRTLPSTAPLHTQRVGFARYGLDPA